MADSAKGRMLRKRGLGLIVVLLATLGGWALQQNSRPAASQANHAVSDPPSAPRTVRVGIVTEERSSAPLEVTGTVHASLRSDVSAKIMGRVAQVLVNEGDRVGAGQVLVRLESSDLQAAVAQAEAGLRAAQEAVKQARTGAQIQTVTSSTRVEQARAALEAARQQLSLVTEGPRRQQKLQAD
ncbi:MAG: biotin/lipoyl-binding protein, partial [Armatimonadota bacterium]|nr:biotin/lipoyl-binding protein [Armatimonadota bacterium]